MFPATFSLFPFLIGYSRPQSEQLPVSMAGKPCRYVPEPLRWGIWMPAPSSSLPTQERLSPWKTNRKALMVSVLDVPIASMPSQEAPANTSPPRLGAIAQRGIFRDVGS